MEQKQNSKTSPAPTPQNQAPKKSGNKALWWILGGCLVLIVISGLALGGIAYWSYKKVKKEIKENQPKIEEWQNNLEKTGEQAKPIVEEVPTAISEEGTTGEDTSSLYPPAVTEKAMGYIKKVYTKGGKNYLGIDYIQWFMGDAAEKAMREDGECPKTGECIVYNDYYIRNANPLIRTFEIAPEAEITMQTYEMEATGQIHAQKINISQFSQIWNTSAKSHMQNMPYRVGIGNNEILSISEQYIP